MSVRPRKIVILGSTGSIGEQTLQVVDQHPDKFEVVGLAARDEVDALARQIEKYRPRAAGLGNEKYYGELKEKVGARVPLLMGMEGMCQIAALDEVDTVVVAMSGAVGILPTLAAIRRSRRIALANKETLVAAGDLVMKIAEENGAEIIPVDSEHSAIFQCLAGESRFLRNLWLTASGGPFRDFNAEQLATVTVEMALQHPNWQMGPKITVDSATLMNKGLEVIEAHHLFGVDYDHIQVLVQAGMTNQFLLVHDFFYQDRNIQKLDLAMEKTVYRSFIGGIHYRWQGSTLAPRLICQVQQREKPRIRFLKMNTTHLAEVQNGGRGIETFRIG